MIQAYNNWHIDNWCGAEPGRFIPLSIPAILLICPAQAPEALIVNAALTSLSSPVRWSRSLAPVIRSSSRCSAMTSW